MKQHRRVLNRFREVHPNIVKFKVTKQQYARCINCAVSLNAACVGACLMSRGGVSAETMGGAE